MAKGYSGGMAGGGGVDGWWWWWRVLTCVKISKTRGKNKG